MAPRGVRRGGGYFVVRALCGPEERRENRIALIYLCAAGAVLCICSAFSSSVMRAIKSAARR